MTHAGAEPNCLFLVLLDKNMELDLWTPGSPCPREHEGRRRARATLGSKPWDGCCRRACGNARERNAAAAAAA